MNFTFTVSPQEVPPPSGFDMGDVRVEGSHTTASSTDGGPRHLMMIHLSVAQLLDRLSRLASRADRECEFMGVDGSFVLHFSRRGDGTLVTRRKRQVIDESAAWEVLRAAVTEAQRFADVWLPQLPVDDAGAEDLALSLSEAKRLLVSQQSACGGR
ncbi:hypothetical protein PJ985_14425 [Streptomyces sp. ACA25]|uniref:hypothetical protein n=1 Tax=Streptomyces sp. ACA25 TaxID=3022596 RepID=UPI002307E606|nr:hypothetical protein [Streptomyces sp. ACA25]MDB1088760.1 hypothetical protein [Streptomyces sp. ACA25]